MTLAEVVLGVMFVGLIAYALFGGADFGAGIWDLLAGGTRRGAPPARGDRARDRAGLGGQPRLADLRAGRAVDRVPGRVHAGGVHAVRAADARGVRDDRPRRGVRVPQEHHHAADAPLPRRGVRGVVAGHAVLPGRGRRRGRVRAGAAGHRHRRRRDQLGQPHLDRSAACSPCWCAPTSPRSSSASTRCTRATPSSRTGSGVRALGTAAVTGLVGLAGLFVLRADAPLLARRAVRAGAARGRCCPCSPGWPRSCCWWSAATRWRASRRRSPSPRSSSAGPRPSTPTCCRRTSRSSDAAAGEATLVAMLVSLVIGSLLARACARLPLPPLPTSGNDPDHARMTRDRAEGRRAHRHRRPPSRTR